MKDYSFLLNRPEHKFDDVTINKELEGKNVLVTGAGGSIGSAIVERLLRSPVNFVGCVGHSELPLFNLRSQIKSDRIGYAVADIQQLHVMRQLFKQWQPEIVFHAAAYKHVGLMESQPGQAFTNNTVATVRLAQLALESHSVRRFVFISTDKAVKPTSVMGASKRVAEVALQHRFDPFATICRFGNVLGSSGSLVEIAERKFAAGEPLIVTSPEMKRFFITAHEAVGLVLTAALLEEPGKIYSIDMGDPVNILDVVKKLMTPESRYQLSYAGTGEKIIEEILNDTEVETCAYHPGLIKILGKSNPRVDEALVLLAQDPHRLVEVARTL